MNTTFLWCIVGFVFFCVGVSFRMYIVVRVKGWSGYLSQQTGVMDSYRQLIAEKHAPLWPLPMSYLCMSLGILIGFVSILFGN